ncbi:MAG TPA: PAS domain-containing protein, partial [Bacteroidales bacterium]|nr:PAS domain-containing protein [Bacteroidales bacterium]
ICSYSTNLNVNEIEKSDWVCSPEFYNVFGIDKTYPHTIEGWAGFIHPDYREEVFAYHESVVKEKKQFNREYKIKRINDGAERWVHGTGFLEYDEKGNPVRMHGAIQDITDRKQVEASLQRIEWMLSKKVAVEKKQGTDYGDLSELNTDRLILDSVGAELLREIANDYLNLLETSSAIYEKNGDYALGIFTSGWCRLMDQASRDLCDTDNNKEALECGKWLCHESCWKEASQPAMNTGRPVDIECEGGIKLYALPIVAGGKVIGALNFGYGDPPKDKEKLSELSEKFQVPLNALIKESKAYESRPPYIINMGKDRLRTSAKLIGEIVSRKITEKKILTLNEQLEQKVNDKTKELKERVDELERFHDATIQREFRIKELRDEMERIKRK